MLSRPRETNAMWSVGAADASRDERERDCVCLVALENHSLMWWDHRVEQRKNGEK